MGKGLSVSVISGLVGLLAKRKTSKLLVATVHEYGILTEPDILFGLDYQRYDVIVKHVIKKADAVTVNSIGLERFNPAISLSEHAL